MWMDLGKHVNTNPTNGYKKLKKKIVIFTLRDRSTSLDNEKHASSFYMSKLWKRLERLNCHDREHKTGPKFLTKVKEIVTLQQRFHNFKMSYIPRGQNDIVDCLTKIIVFKLGPDQWSDMVKLQTKHESGLVNVKFQLKLNRRKTHI